MSSSKDVRRASSRRSPLAPLLPLLWFFCALLCSPAGAHAQTLSGEPLVTALRQGGYVIVMRHAHSPRSTPPDSAHAAPGNTKLERELDAAGRETAAAMGAALKQLGIPVAEAESSPTFRALETVRLLGLQAKAVPELGDGGQGMKADTEGTRSAWLRRRVAEVPASGNALLVTHLPNLAGAFPDAARDMTDGEALIFRPDGKEAAVVGRVPIEEWPRLAAQAGRE